MKLFSVIWLKAKALMPAIIVIYVLIWFIAEKHYGLLIPLLTIFVFISLGVLWGEIDVRRKRRQGIYPREGLATMKDVKRLALSGHDDLALRAYLEINDVSLAKGSKAIKEIIDCEKKNPK